MNTFKKKSLHAAVLAGLAALGAAGTANAVHINPDGQGQVLVFPYYTVRNGFATAMSIVNTTSFTKIVKVRFLEGKNSREVLDFNLFLSPQDVWTGVVIPTAAGAKLETGDNSCVTPSDLFGNAAGVIRTDGTLPINEFKNYTYISPTADNTAFGTLDRTREGYMEVIEMGVVTNVIVTGYIKHNSAGVPANCAALDAYDGNSISAPVTAGAAGRFAQTGGHLTSPIGGQFGRASIINSALGSNYDFEPTAVDGWWAPAVAGTAAYFPSGDLNPNISLTTGISTVSNVFVTGTPGVATSAGVVTANWLTSRDAVSAIFMRNTVANEFLTDAATLSKTDWVITMPTKKNHISVGTGVPAVGGRPFSNNFASATPTGACDAYSLGMYNREEQTLTAAPGVLLPSPLPPAQTAAGQVLCWEANVLEFGTTGLLGSNNNFRLLNGFDAFGTTGATSTGAAFATLSRRVLQGPNGWAFLGFGNTVADPTQAQQSITPASSSLNGVADAVPRTHYGLPIIGFMVHNYTNTGVNSAYGGEVGHKFTRDIR